MHRFFVVLACAAGLPAQATWSQRPPTNVPPRANAAMAYDQARRLTVLFGGAGLSDTWEYNGAAWVQRTGVGGPNFFPSPNRPALAATFDSTRGVTVLTNSWGFETWEYSGAQWTLRHTSPILSNRINYALAFDSIRNVVVLFGGTYLGNEVGLSETWVWDGVTWTQRGSGGPHPRHLHAMAFDDRRGVALLFGGSSADGGSGSGSYLLRDTWQWNGTFWLEHFGITGPSARMGAQMVNDSRRQRIVLFGGDNTISRNDTWEWDGAAWHAVTPTASPPGAGTRPMVFDQARGVAVLWLPPTTGSDLWEYVVGASPASFAAFGQGCAGPAGVPALASLGASLPRLGTTFTTRLSILPSTPFNIPFGVLGFDATTWNGLPLPVSLDPLGFTGCQAWLAPALSATLTNQGGMADWSFAVPLDIDLAGLDFYLQGAVLAPGWNLGGMVFSNAGHGVIGTP